MSFNWNLKLGNPNNLQNSKPRWKDATSQDALDRKRLVIASNTVEFLRDIKNPRFSPLAPLSNFPGTPAMQSLTPFRALFNAGDPNGSVNSPIIGNTANKGGEPISRQYTQTINQVSRGRRSANSSSYYLGGSVPTTASQNGSYWVGNPKYVYDGSDYVKFKKLQAQNKNFKDPTFGGDKNNASQVAISHARRSVRGV